MQMYTEVEMVDFDAQFFLWISFTLDATNNAKVSLEFLPYP